MTIMPAGIGMSVGSSQGTGQVYFGTTAATVTAWVDDAIVVTVPSLAAGSYNVTVVTGGVTSNPLPFTISATAPSPAMYTGNSTWFSSLGQPYGGCGVPQANLDTQNFVALNVQNTQAFTVITSLVPLPERILPKSVSLKRGELRPLCTCNNRGFLHRHQ